MKFKVFKDEKKEAEWFKKGRLFDFRSAETLQDVSLIANTNVIYHESDSSPEIVKKEGLKAKPNYVRLPVEEIGKIRDVVFVSPRKDIASKYGKYLYKIFIPMITNYKIINDEVDFDSVGVLSNIPSRAILAFDIEL